MQLKSRCELTAPSRFPSSASQTPKEFSMRYAWLALVGCVAMGALGCGTTYYRVTDPTTGRDFYTTVVEKQRGGSVRLRDAGTGRTVTLQNSEVHEVKKEEFDSGRVRQPSSSETAGGNPA